MKGVIKQKNIFLVLVLILLLSFSFVSAGFFSDTWNKITGNVVSDSTNEISPSFAKIAHDFGQGYDNVLDEVLYEDSSTFVGDDEEELDEGASQTYY